MIWPVQQDFYTFITMNKLVLILTLFILGEANSIYGQEIQCLFNPYNKKGSNYFFSTYWDVSPSNLMDGTCIQYMSNTTEIYEKRIFKKGIIQLELTNYINPTRIRTSFERVKRDSTIAEYKQYREDGKL